MQGMLLDPIKRRLDRCFCQHGRICNNLSSSHTCHVAQERGQCFLETRTLNKNLATLVCFCLDKSEHRLNHARNKIRQYWWLEDGSINVITRGQQWFCLKLHWIEVKGKVCSN